MKDTFQDLVACKEAVARQFEGHSLDIAKIVLLSMLRDTIRFEMGTPDLIAERADQVAEFIKMPDDEAGHV